VCVCVWCVCVCVCLGLFFVRTYAVLCWGPPLCCAAPQIWWRVAAVTCSWWTKACGGKQHQPLLPQLPSLMLLLLLLLLPLVLLLLQLLQLL
jgi:hypothetical protein